MITNLLKTLIKQLLLKTKLNRKVNKIESKVIFCLTMNSSLKRSLASDETDLDSNNGSQEKSREIHVRNESILSLKAI